MRDSALKALYLKCNLLKIGYKLLLDLVRLFLPGVFNIYNVLNVPFEYPDVAI